MLLLTRSHWTPCLDLEYAIEEDKGSYLDEEIYYEEPDLGGAVAGFDYIISYVATDMEEEAQT